MKGTLDMHRSPSCSATSKPTWVLCQARRSPAGRSAHSAARRVAGKAQAAGCGAAARMKVESPRPHYRPAGLQQRVDPRRVEWPEQVVIGFVWCRNQCVERFNRFRLADEVGRDIRFGYESGEAIGHNGLGHPVQRGVRFAADDHCKQLAVTLSLRT
jgi:hypothetical protein